MSDNEQSPLRMFDHLRPPPGRAQAEPDQVQGESNREALERVGIMARVRETFVAPPEPPPFTQEDLWRIDGWIKFARDMSGGLANTRTMSELRAKIEAHIRYREGA